MNNPEQALYGRHALVTGGARGIGRAIAEALARQGAAVTLLGRNRQALTETATALGAGVSAEVADVTDAGAVRAAFAQATERAGPVTILINNAGQAQSAPLHRTDEQMWHRLIAVNLTGTYHCVHTALPGMLAAGHGRIVNIASSAGQVGYPYVAAYCAAKHGVIGLTRSLALETATKGITVNAVCPGYTDTDIVRDTIANIRDKTGRSEAEALAALVEHNPQRRLIRPEEVANAVLWLCLPGSDSITGQSIAVSGGEVT
jgi:3-hydroxybutyrate dehydrogenase